MWLSLITTIGKKIPPWLWIALGVVIVYFIVAWAAYHRGKNEVQRQWDLAVTKDEIATSILREQQVTISLNIETVYQAKIHTIQEVANVIEKEIPIFIPHYNDMLSGGFRLLHDSAATGTFPNRSLIPTAAPVSVGDVTSTINRNYEQCNIWREQVIGWQTWYNEQLRISSSPSS